MSPVYLRKEDVSLSVFEASLPRTVIVEGTFQARHALPGSVQWLC